MAFPLLQIDAFTDQPFAGNPAAVCLLEEPADAVWMQHVAAEMNLSETAFLAPVEDGYRLRWFTPAVEVPLCGHATLASAHALFELGRASADQTIRFHSTSGLLSATRQGSQIWLDFPARFLEPHDLTEPARQALGITPLWCGRNGDDLLLELEDETAVRAVAPDFRRLKAATPHGVVVTSRAQSSEYDFVSRYFAPSYGIDEDPVTGSAHCMLAPFWAHRLGKGELVGFQASARGGVVSVKVDGDRVKLGGHAVTVLRGELL